MFKKIKKILSLSLVASMMLVGCGLPETGEENGGKENGVTQKENKTNNKQKEIGSEVAGEEPIVIKYCPWLYDQNDPYATDSITGEYIMAWDEELRQSQIKILEKVKEKFNVEIEFVPLPGNTREVLLKSVLAGDPIAEIVDLEGGTGSTIIQQNVLKPLNEYVHLLGERPIPPVYGKYFYLGDLGGETGNGRGVDTALAYNIDYIEAVPGLKVDGETVYPTDLYKEGKWTWSTFAEYLRIIDMYYQNTQAPVRMEYTIEPFITDYMESTYAAIHANGGTIYGEEGLQLESKEVKEAVAYIQSLIDEDLLQTILVEGTSDVPWASQVERFALGETVFSEVEGWRLVGAGAQIGERGQSVGVIPFPRPDHMEPNDPAYQPVSMLPAGHSVILRGTNEEKIPLIIEVFNFYTKEQNAFRASRNELSGVPKEMAAFPGTDGFHEKIGTDMNIIINEWLGYGRDNSRTLGLYFPSMRIIGDSLFGIGGSPKYDIAIEARKYEILDEINEIERLLETTQVKDNISPKLRIVDGVSVVAFEKGTDPGSVDWKQWFAAEDNIDGVMDSNQITFDIEATDFDTVGLYEKGLIATITDSSDNIGEIQCNITIYDGENKQEPTIKLREEYRVIKVDEDSAKINWREFIDASVDKDGLDIAHTIEADLSNLDTTTPGKYEVGLIVTDFVGNQSQQIIEVIVE